MTNRIPDAPEPSAVAASDAAFAELDQLPTEELRHRAFSLARERHDLGFFWSVLSHLSRADDAEAADSDLGEFGKTIEDAIALWREFTGRGYGESEPLLRAAFIDYLLTPRRD